MKSFPSGLGSFDTQSTVQASSCFLDPWEIIDSHRRPLDTPRFDELLDGVARPRGPVGCSDRGSGNDHLEGIQIASRRLCPLLRLLAQPHQNIAHFDRDDSVNEALLFRLLHELYHKATTLWEALFEHLRIWVSEPRKKANFPQHKRTVATSLAQLSACVDLYSEALAKWSDRGMPMVELAYETPQLLTHLEYLGRGIEMRSFEAERKRPWIDTLAVHFSMSTADHLRDINRQATWDLICIIYPHIAYMTSIAPKPPSTTFLLCIVHTAPPRLSQATSLNAPDDFEPASQLVSPENLQDFDLDGVMDPVTGHALIEQTKREVEDLRSQLQEAEQTASDLKERIQFGEMMLAAVTAPDHGTLDDPLPPTSSDAADQSENSEAMMLVDSGLKAAIPSAIKEEATDEFPMPNLASHLMDEVDTPMHDSLATDPGSEIDQSLLEIKKRKRFSSHLTSKKVRVHNQAQIPPEISTLPSCKTDYTEDKPCDTDFDGKKVSQPPVDDGSEPRSTSRPTSWPRARLFRRSAGVSVKKLTDAFEKLRMKQAQP
ncbi:MAG: hypothetical protein LQ348_005061 [Seirophora lacunosa]|nr:MAG: hypothetical protein LQ348_005061 [Seirophora lacunosa]